MKKKMFQWPFSRQRQLRVQCGDRLSSEAGDIIESAIYCEDEQRRNRLARKSARLYEKAASCYENAGLGLAARNCILCASESWAWAEDDDLAIGCDRRAETIDTYWEEEVDETTGD